MRTAPRCASCIMKKTASQFFASSFVPDSFDTRRDSFIGAYHTERNPIGVERGTLAGTAELGGNPCGALHGRLVLQPGEEKRVLFYLGTGGTGCRGKGPLPL